MLHYREMPCFLSVAEALVARDYSCTPTDFKNYILNYTVRNDPIYFSLFKEYWTNLARSENHSEKDLYSFSRKQIKLALLSINLSKKIPLKFRIHACLFGIISNLYYLAGKVASPPPGPHTLIKSWSDRNEDFLNGNIQDIHFVIFPFFRPFRQLTWAFSLWQRGVSFSFFGHKHLAHDLIQILKTSDLLKYSYIQVNITQRSGQKFIGNFNAKQLITTDEWDLSGFVFNRELSKNDISVCGRLHGIGVYCPVVFYDRLEYLVDSQKAYYLQFGFIAEFYSLKYSVKKFNFLEHCKKSPIFLFFGQYGADLRDELLTEESKAIDFIRANHTGRLIYKFHPNSTRNSQKIIKRHLAQELEFAIKLEAKCFPTAEFSLFSTAALEATRPHFLLKTSGNDPRLLFGDFPNILEVERD